MNYQEAAIYLQVSLEVPLDGLWEVIWGQLDATHPLPSLPVSGTAVGIQRVFSPATLLWGFPQLVISSFQSLWGEWSVLSWRYLVF